MPQFTRWFTVSTGLTAALLFVACGSPSTQTSGASPASGDCILVTPPPMGGDTVSVTITEDITLDHAPVPHNDGERLVYRHLYNTLIRLDCDGEPVSALAESWRSADGGRHWEFVLASNAKFWDGSRVTAADVARSWHAQGYWQAQGVGPDSVLVVSGSEIPVAVFSDQRMAIVKERTGTHPLGTGPYRIAESHERELTAVMDAPQSESVIHFRILPEVDARDAIDLGTDLLVTSDPRAIEYAAGRTDFEAAPLPWARTYLAVTPYGSVIHTAGLPEDLRASLARDAVRAEARGSEPPYWWHGLRSCMMRHQEGAPESPAEVRLEGQAKHVVYRRGDQVSRDLAERLVALTSSDAQLLSQLGVRSDLVERIAGGQDDIAAAGLSGEQFAASWRQGRELLYIVEVNRFETDPCRAAEDWIAGAPWLAQAPTSDVLEGNLARKLIPIVDTRSRAIVRDGSLGLRVDWDGTVFLLVR
jgi:hypothetical protein